LILTDLHRASLAPVAATRPPWTVPAMTTAADLLVAHWPGLATPQVAGYTAWWDGPTVDSATAYLIMCPEAQVLRANGAGAHVLVENVSTRLMRKLRLDTITVFVVSAVLDSSAQCWDEWLDTEADVVFTRLLTEEFPVGGLRPHDPVLDVAVRLVQDVLGPLQPGPTQKVARTVASAADDFGFVLLRSTAFALANHARSLA
jgi:hypothetical protein